MKNIQHFFANLNENDIVNVRVHAENGSSDDENTPSVLRRARVVQFVPEGIEIELRDDEGNETERRIVTQKDVEQRVQVPWKPRDLADNFIVFRRRLGRTETYVEDLRVRKNFVRRVLTLLMERGFYRPDQGEQCRHMYYSTCDLAESNIEELPEDDVPGDLHFRDIDEQLPTGNVTRKCSRTG